MRARFIACSACGRHVREGDAGCPFCGAAPLLVPAPAPATNLRLARAAMLAAGAAGGVAILADCGSSPSATYFYGVACTNDACASEPYDAASGQDGPRFSADVEVSPEAGDAGAADAPSDGAPSDAGPDGEPSEAQPPDAGEAGGGDSG